ncbi:hypothetical protein L873DRAFT_1848123 [Choiromyces venosus 120613-1]|uniref:Uncharacterized protein n=1 Tax=Choiromyces venosus 120613-1 TaxID=1336337 RepID=A0A3N4J3C0_9PEZI|nr:hypothetical protein L873DRAFT_1848123 [Choiromyces venosus 120613-1]
MREGIQEILKDFAVCDIYNCDELALQYNMRLDTTIAQKGKVIRGSKKNKTRITVFLTVNVNGSDKHQAMLINKSKTPIAFRKLKINPENIPLIYRYNRKPLDAGIIRSLKAGYWHRFVQHMVDYFEKYGEAAPNLDVLQVSILSLIDTSCNSEQVNTLANLFLDYNEEAEDEDARPEDISLTEIVDYLNSNGFNASDLNSDSDTLEITPPKVISIALANTYLSEITTLLERFPVDILQTNSHPLLISTAVQHLQKIQQGFHYYEGSKKKQVTLANWLQIGTTMQQKMGLVTTRHLSGIPECISPELAPISSSAIPKHSSTPTPSPPSQLLRFSPIALADWNHDSYNVLNPPFS